MGLGPDSLTALLSELRKPGDIWSHEDNLLHDDMYTKVPIATDHNGEMHE